MKLWQGAVGLILWLNRFFRHPEFTLPTEEAARTPREKLQEEEYRRFSEEFIALRGLTSLKDAVVLDLACGSGIKTTSLAATLPEVRQVLGIDVNTSGIRQGRDFSQVRRIDRVIFLVADAGALPFKDHSINLVVSENAFEHVPDPGATLREVGRVLTHRGLLCLRFFPMYYSRYGSHLWDYLCVPWAHVWAPAKVVTEAYRRIIEAETPRVLRAFAGQYDAEDIRQYVAGQIDVFTTLNKLTPRGFYRAVAASGGWRILRFSFISTSVPGRLLAYVPWVDRFAVWGISCVLQRDGDATLDPGAFLRLRCHQDLQGAARRFVARVTPADGRD